MAYSNIIQLRAWVVKRGRYVTITNPTDKMFATTDENYQSVLNYAISIYDETLSEYKLYETLGREIHVELFEPFVHGTGQLATWPDDGCYIERYFTKS